MKVVLRSLISLEVRRLPSLYRDCGLRMRSSSSKSNYLINLEPVRVGLSVASIPDTPPNIFRLPSCSITLNFYRLTLGDLAKRLSILLDKSKLLE
jgi:hypothetical protein